MSQQTTFKNKGGRPAKPVKRNRVISLKCTRIEQVRINAMAKKSGLSVSEYLREMGLHGQIVTREKALPKEVLFFTGTLNHLAANLNQIARKRDGVTDELNAMERTSLEILFREVKQMALTIKAYLA